MKIAKMCSALLIVVWLFGAVILGLYNNFHDSRACIERDGLIKASLSCSNVSPLGFGRNMFLGALWPVLLVGSAGAQGESVVPEHVTQEQFENSNAGGWYTCMAVALRAGKTEDARLLGEAIRFMKSKSETIRKQHDDFVTLATRASAKLDSVGRSNQFYEAVCSKSLENLKQLASRPSK
jgi:hypothetical protein